MNLIIPRVALRLYLILADHGKMASLEKVDSRFGLDGMVDASDKP